MCLIRIEPNKLVGLFTLVVSVLCSCKKTPETVQAKEQAVVQAKEQAVVRTKEQVTVQTKERMVSQPIIRDLKWGQVEVEMPDGSPHKFTYCIITPQNCIAWNYKKFGHKTGRVISHLYSKSKKRGTGVLPYAVEELLRGAPSENVVVIVSVGMLKELGVSPDTVYYLRGLKEGSKIDDFHILHSQKVREKHNSCVKEGKKVYTLLHSTC